MGLGTQRGVQLGLSLVVVGGIVAECPGNVSHCRTLIVRRRAKGEVHSWQKRTTHKVQRPGGERQEARRYVMVGGSAWSKECIYRVWRGKCVYGGEK